MNYAFICLGALYLILITPSLAAQEITCSHPQLCNIVRDLYAHDIPKTFKLRTLDIKGDPHHYEPGTRELSQLMRAPYLIAGPVALHPWIKPVIEHRKKAQLPTLILKLEADFTKKYAPSTQEALSHFWLLPELYCQYSQQILHTLKQWTQSDGKLDCEDKTLLLLEARLKPHSPKKTIILSHDALEPYLRSLGFEVFTLKGSHHGESITAQALKNLQAIQSNPSPMLWVFEHGIQVPKAIEKLRRTQDLSIQVDILGRKEQPSTRPLKTILREMIRVHSS
jgi:ABC-type Zn uptake system ZnuABC Zn-binding protein ZnuA